MSGRKTPVTLKPSDLVEKRISQLFKDLREASGNVRNQNNEELLPEKKDDHLDINKKVSHAFFEAFSDPTSIPPPEPTAPRVTKGQNETDLAVIDGYLFLNGKIEKIFSVEDALKNKLSSTSQVVLSTGIGTDSETIIIQIPTMNPITHKRIWIYCEIQRKTTDKAWDESAMVKMKNILVHLEKLVHQTQN